MRSTPRTLATVVNLVALVWLAGAPAYGAPVLVEVATCGQHVPAHAVGFLTADLDCASVGGPAAVYLGKRAQFDLRGFTLTASGSVSVACEPLLYCSLDGCFSKSGKCEVSNGTLIGSSDAAIVGGRVTIRDLTIESHTNYAVLAQHRIDVSDCHIENAPLGLQANERITIVGSSMVVAAAQAKRVDLLSSSITLHPTEGVVGWFVRLVDSHVTGNGTDPGCGSTKICSDLSTHKKPKLDATSTCDVSWKETADVPGSWGICALD